MEFILSFFFDDELELDKNACNVIKIWFFRAQKYTTNENHDICLQFINNNNLPIAFDYIFRLNR